MIVEVPADTPVQLTGLPVEPMVATLVLLLLHVPPDVALDSVVELVSQMMAVPPIAAGTELMVTICVAIQPATEYVIRAVPEVTPVTTPVVPSTVALPLLLLHVPPVNELDSDVV